jgi:hypothetical protein
MPSWPGAQFRKITGSTLLLPYRPTPPCIDGNIQRKLDMDQDFPKLFTCFSLTQNVLFKKCSVFQNLMSELQSLFSIHFCLKYLSHVSFKLSQKANNSERCRCI